MSPEIPGFSVKDNGKTWTVECRHCPARWSLKKGSEENIGVKLHLLNHRVGHEQEVKGR